jgi:hypothetical protein
LNCGEAETASERSTAPRLVKKVQNRDRGRLRAV